MEHKTLIVEECLPSPPSFECFWQVDDEMLMAPLDRKAKLPFRSPFCKCPKEGKGGIYLEWGLGTGEESFCEVSAAGSERESEREAGSGREEL